MDDTEFYFISGDMTADPFCLKHTKKHNFQVFK